MSISLLSDSGLLQSLSSPSIASSASGLKTLSSVQAPLESQIATSSSSVQLAEDTYTSSGQTKVAQGSSTSSSNSQSSAASAVSSSQGSQGDTVSLANLIQNQTISGSSDVRQVLANAISSQSSGDPEATAWNNLTDKVNSGDYSGAQTALTNYSTALVNSHIGMWADLSPIQNDLAVLGSALKAGNSTDVQTAFTALTSIAPTHNLGLVLSVDSGTTWFAANMADALQGLGYTAANAAVEANAFVLGYAADAATVHVVALGAPADPISDSPDVNQSITDLAKAAAQSTDTNMLSSILTGMGQATSVSAMESTLTQLDSKYGTAAQGTDAGNGGQASVSAYA